MPKGPIKTASTKLKTSLQPNLEDEIRRRAYQIYDSRGRQDGHDLEDWFRAEAEVTGSGVKIAAA